MFVKTSINETAWMVAGCLCAWLGICAVAQGENEFLTRDAVAAATETHDRVLSLGNNINLYFRDAEVACDAILANQPTLPRAGNQWDLESEFFLRREEYLGVGIWFDY